MKSLEASLDLPESRSAIPIGTRGSAYKSDPARRRQSGLRPERSAIEADRLPDSDPRGTTRLPITAFFESSRGTRGGATFSAGNCARPLRHGRSAACRGLSGRDPICRGRTRERVMLNLMRSYPLDTVRRAGIRPLPSAVSGVSRGIGTNIGVDIDFLLFARPGTRRRADTQPRAAVYNVSGSSRRDSYASRAIFGAIYSRDSAYITHTANNGNNVKRERKKEAECPITETTSPPRPPKIDNVSIIRIHCARPQASNRPDNDSALLIERERPSVGVCIGC